ncbi:hypothetical protein SPURM210S_03846 [Streptomyces purpurascens]|nr:hypothetical protein GCM10010303_83790 [Streptomyces purpurascens]
MRLAGIRGRLAAVTVGTALAAGTILLGASTAHAQPSPVRPIALFPPDPVRPIVRQAIGFFPPDPIRPIVRETIGFYPPDPIRPIIRQVFGFYPPDPVEPPAPIETDD